MASAASLSVGTAALPAATQKARLSRYAADSPRYTTYPDMERFTPLSGAELCQALDHSNVAGRPLSLYVHVPFCRRHSGYGSGPRIVTQDTSRAEPYLSRLDREMVLLARHLDTTRPVEQLYWGGETPAFLSLGQMSDLFDRLDARFGLSTAPERDYAIKLDPREADVFTLRHLQLLGFNRLSLAVLDFNPEVQRAINHEHPRVLTETLMEEAHRLGFRSLNIDIGYGLPQQTRESLAVTLDHVIELNPARITLLDDSTEERFSSPAKRLALLQQAVEQLTAAGYARIGTDHFSRPGDSLSLAADNQTLQRSLQGYTTHGHCDLIGLGLSALSRIDDVYARNHVCPRDYADALDAGNPATARGWKLSPDDVIRRAAIGQLMSTARLDLAALSQRFNIDAASYFAPLLARLAEAERDGLIEQSGAVITATPAGRLVLRQLAAAFDAYL